MKPNSSFALSKEYDHIVPFATEVIKSAGRRLLNDFGQVSSSPKGEFDLVTETDVAVENFIQTELQHRFPTHQVIAEEGHQAGEVALSEFCWVIDPLDGTVNFALGIPFFSVALALLYQGQPILGWVYDPIRDELFHARQGGGSFVNERRLEVEPKAVNLLPVGGSSGFLGWGLKVDSALILQTLLGRFGKLRILGSQALQLSYVAAGRLRAAISWESRLWDDMAGALIVKEAGASYTNFWGQDIFPLVSNSPLLAGEAIHSVAAIPETHQEILALLAQTRPPGADHAGGDRR